MQKEFFETTLPARLKKYEGFLESRDGGKAYLFGEKVRKMRKRLQGCGEGFISETRSSSLTLEKIDSFFENNIIYLVKNKKRGENVFSYWSFSEFSKSIVPHRKFSLNITEIQYF